MKAVREGYLVNSRTVTWAQPWVGPCVDWARDGPSIFFQVLFLSANRSLIGSTRLFIFLLHAEKILYFKYIIFIFHKI